MKFIGETCIFLLVLRISFNQGFLNKRSLVLLLGCLMAKRLDIEIVSIQLLRASSGKRTCRLSDENRLKIKSRQRELLIFYVLQFIRRDLSNWI